MYTENKQKVTVKISDPWEFGTIHGVGPFDGYLVKLFSSPVYANDKMAVIKLNTILEFKGIEYQFLLAQARHTNSSIIDIMNGGNVSCNFSNISKKSAYAMDPLIESKNDSRGSILIGTLSSLF